MPFKVYSMLKRTKKLDPAYDQKSLLFRFRKHCAGKEFLKKSDRILIACSGGPDSIALFHLARLVFPEHEIVIAHFNHGIRAKTAKRDETFVKQLAAKFKLPFFVGRAKLAKKSSRKKLSLEEAARAKRYEFLKMVYRRSKSSAAFFAHHLDDQAETVLMRVCQGTGLRGLLGIREQMKFEGMRVIRPLLAFSKAEMTEFLKQNRFSFCSDETNHSTDYLRNRIRLEILPFLAKKINPRVIQALARIPEIIGVESDLIAEMEAQAVKEVTVSVSSKRVLLKAVAFRALHSALQFRVLDWLIKRLDPAAGLLFENGALIKKSLKNSRFQVSLPRGLELKADSRRILIQKSS